MNQKLKTKGWVRVLLIIIPYFLTIGFLQELGTYISGQENSSELITESTEELLIVSFFAFLGTVLVIYLFMKKIDKEPFGNLGLYWKSHKRGAVVGLLTGLAIMIISYLFLFFFKEIKFVKTTFLSGDFFSTILLFFIVSLSEEIMFRGYVLRNLMGSMNNFIALLISAMVFALMHAANPNLSLIGNINLFLAGVLLGLPYIYTKNLMFPIAFHFSWNYFQSLFGFNVSGLDSYSLIEFETTQNTWVNGGDFGFEGSVLATVLQIILIVALYFVFNNKKSEKLSVGF
ncbi:MAG: CPBP family intramembrane metalloprotease [Muricauda sp.]|nr:MULTISPECIES: type II CAAX endopeptidase family protein [unclassified Allomuricauda]MAU16067.1 CPBP family intramembrane metalloprotease [Allomuricauda sp.]|tara:strand:- start:653 stop:1513 length:861 start_codon:yes stop_codon:yes gene_type:complete